MPHPVRRVIALVLGTCPATMTPEQIQLVMTTDLVALKTVGSGRAGATIAAISSALNGWRPPTGPAAPAPMNVRSIARQIRDEHLSPPASAERLGIPEQQLRAMITESSDSIARSTTRRWSIYDHAMAGASLRDIGEAFGVSSERVRQVLQSYGLNVRVLRAQHRRRAAEALERRCQEIAGFVRAFPGVTEDEIAKVLELDDAELAELTSGVRHLILRPVDNNELSRLDQRRRQVIAALRAAAAIESPLSGPRFDALVNEGRVPGPGRQTVMILFGTWNAGCDAAGVEHLEPARNDYERAWSEADIIAAVATYLCDPHVSGSADGYESWAREREVPSAALVRNRFQGSWTEACRHALVETRTSWTRGDDRTDFGSWLHQR